MKLLIVLAVLFVCQSYGQTTCENTEITTNPNDTCPCPDVYLNVPDLLQNLEAHVSLNAKVASLVSLKAGVDVSIQKVNLTISGVGAKLQLVVRLGNIEKIVARALTTLDKNPGLLTGLLGAVTDLLSSTVNSLGQVLSRTVDQLGNIVEKVVDDAGNIISQNIVGSVLDLTPISSVVNSLGQTVLNVRDTSGTLIEVVLDAAGNVLSTKTV